MKTQVHLLLISQKQFNHSVRLELNLVHIGILILKDLQNKIVSPGENRPKSSKRTKKTQIPLVGIYQTASTMQETYTHQQLGLEKDLQNLHQNVLWG